MVFASGRASRTGGLLLASLLLGAASCTAPEPAAAPPAPPVRAQDAPRPTPPVLVDVPEVPPAPPTPAPVAVAPAAPTLLDTLGAAYPPDLARPADTTGGAAWTERTLARLTPEQRVYQMVMAGIPAGSSWAQVRPSMLALARAGVGGFLVPRLWAPDEVFRAATELQAVAPVPLLMAADYERGVGRGSNPLTEFPAAMAFGAAGDPSLAGVAGRVTAIESRAVGINFVFAPVVDVNTEPRNPIINTRAYGERAEDVARMAEAYVREAERFGALTTLKHFPGHGDTREDTHAELAVVSTSRTALEAVHLAPYRALFASAAPPAAVMVAHVAAPALEAAYAGPTSGTPYDVTARLTGARSATLSPALVTGLLRRQLGYDGLVVTDDVQMGALRGMSEAERAVRPVEAGADIVLTPRDAHAAARALSAALASGRITSAQVAASARRVLRAKARAGLHREAAPREAAFRRVMAGGLGQPFARQIAARSATLVKAAPGALPVRGRVLLVQLANTRATGALGAGVSGLARALAPAAERRFDGPVTLGQARALAREAEGYDAVVIAAHFRIVQSRGDVGLVAGHATLVHELVAGRTPVVMAGFGNPYALAAFGEADALLLHYDSTLPSVESAVRVLRGLAPAPGRLPVTLDGFPYGTGVGAF